MEIGKINAAIEQIGYNAAGISSVGSDEDIKKFAEKNGISVEEAKNILKEAEEKAEENDKIMAQESALMAEVLNAQDEEELIVIDDNDFDNFLKQKSPEQQMQNLLHQQQFANQDKVTQDPQKPENAGNLFAQEDNPFLNMKW